MTEVYKYRRAGQCKCWVYQIVDGEEPIASITVKDGADPEAVCEGLAEVLDHLAAGWPVAGEVSRRENLAKDSTLTDFEREVLHVNLHKALDDCPALREVALKMAALFEAPA